MNDISGGLARLSFSSTMSAQTWLKTLKDAKKTSMVSDGRKKIHYTFSDSTEMVEEYDTKTDDLLVRKWRKRTALGVSGEWEFEIGEAPKRFNPSEGLLLESSSNPILARADTKTHFQWRIRNLPYPIDVYSVTVNTEEKVIIVRTSNKKYYKKFNIPDMVRCGQPLDPNKVKYTHASNTLIIMYEKPPAILECENIQRLERKNAKWGKEGDVDCNQS
eukprot:Colp12_sorted_trinity150504_noHs@22642